MRDRATDDRGSIRHSPRSLLHTVARANSPKQHGYWTKCLSRFLARPPPGPLVEPPPTPMLFWLLWRILLSPHRNRPPRRRLNNPGVSSKPCSKWRNPSLSIATSPLFFTTSPNVYTPSSILTFSPSSFTIPFATSCASTSSRLVFLPQPRQAAKLRSMVILPAGSGSLSNRLSSATPKKITVSPIFSSVSAISAFVLWLWFLSPPRSAASAPWVSDASSH